jgi:hypothetical protein
LPQHWLLPAAATWLSAIKDVWALLLLLLPLQRIVLHGMRRGLDCMSSASQPCCCLAFSKPQLLFRGRLACTSHAMHHACLTAWADGLVALEERQQLLMWSCDAHMATVRQAMLCWQSVKAAQLALQAPKVGGWPLASAQLTLVVCLLLLAAKFRLKFSQQHARHAPGP